MKYWNEIEDQKDELCNMAFELSDLNILSPETRRMLYNDLNGITDDMCDDPNIIEIETYLENEQIAPLNRTQLKAVSSEMNKNGDANQSLWYNVERAYEIVKKEESK